MQTTGGPHQQRALRQAVLALAVMDEVDLDPRDDGVELAAGGKLSWADVACALGPWVEVPDHPVTRHRLRVAAELLGVVAVGGAASLLDALHVRGEPVDTSAMQAGAGWVRERVPGGSLALGLGVSDLAGVPGTNPLPPLPTLAGALGARLDLRWAQARLDLERLGGLVARRLVRDRAEGRALVLRPMGTADVVTLLGSRRLREHLATGDGTGMRAVAVPVRERGWFDLARIDPAYVRAAWAASEPLTRAFDTPLLVTRDEVASPQASADVRAEALARVLRDPAGPSPRSDVRWR